MRPIDGDALEKVLDKWRKEIGQKSREEHGDELAFSAGMEHAISGAISELLLLPVIPAESCNHAEWEMNEWEDAKCKSGEHTLCTARCTRCQLWCEEVRDWTGRVEYKYCPNCGARMDGESDAK